MASLQERHQKSCALGQRVVKLDTPGCTCKPTYLVVVNTGQGGRRPVGKNKKEAARELRKIEHEHEEGTLITKPNLPFAKWADEWLASFTGKETSRIEYTYTIGYAKRAFGTKRLRSLQTSDVSQFLDVIREANACRGKEKGKTVSDATLRKHLRGLSACLEAARVNGYVGQNVATMLHGSQRPRQVEKRPTYFTDAELAKLWAVLPAEPARKAIRTYIYKTLVTTGMRAGEALALTWSDIDLLAGEIDVSKTVTEKKGIGVTEPKTKGSRRTVDMTPAARSTLEAWYALVSTSLYDVGPGALVFPDPQGAHLSETNLCKRWYTAMKRAGVEREGEHGRKRTLHSLRHTFARVTGENGAPLEWIGAQLGHSSIKITRDTYGHWSREAEKKMAASLDGAFPF